MKKSVQEKMEDRIVSTIQVYYTVNHLIGVKDINEKEYTKESLIRWSLNPERKFICVFCQNICSELSCLTCGGYKGVIPLLGGDAL